MSRPVVIPRAVLAQMDGKPLECVVNDCDMVRTPMSVAQCTIYECTRCGEEEERDYS